MRSRYRSPYAMTGDPVPVNDDELTEEQRVIADTLRKKFESVHPFMPSGSYDANRDALRLTGGSIFDKPLAALRETENRVGGGWGYPAGSNYIPVNADDKAAMALTPEKRTPQQKQALKQRAKYESNFQGQPGVTQGLKDEAAIEAAGAQGAYKRKMEDAAKAGYDGTAAPGAPEPSAGAAPSAGGGGVPMGAFGFSFGDAGKQSGMTPPAIPQRQHGYALRPNPDGTFTGISPTVNDGKKAVYESAAAALNVFRPQPIDPARARMPDLKLPPANYNMFSSAGASDRNPARDAAPAAVAAAPMRMLSQSAPGQAQIGLRKSDGTRYSAGEAYESPFTSPSQKIAMRNKKLSSYA